ncbi:MAG: ATP-binding protein [Cyanobacteria bacterium P01_H01_bin.35]
MLKKLRLKNFKNFKNAELYLDSFTILIGTNASGKSNIRDALRFLHGISRGYNLAEIMGEKYVEGGVLQWRGIRGGTKEVGFQGNNFGLEVTFSIPDYFQGKETEKEAIYQIEVNLGSDNQPPNIITERLTFTGESESLIEAKLQVEKERKSLIVKVYNKPYHNPLIPITIYQPILSQMAQTTNVPIVEGYIQPSSSTGKLKAALEQLDFSLGEEYILTTSLRGKLKATLQAFSNMRFLDLNPEVIRLPSFPGQNVLGDRGENLSSILLDICQNNQKKETLLEWIRELTPMDAKDFEFPTDFTGKTLLTLVEENGQKISAYSASDGTLRFLAIIAALLGSESAQFYFFEELDNGIHPTRLHLLLQLIESQVSQGKIQIIATTHSSQLLRLVSQRTLEAVSLIYRLENRPDAKIIRILDIPDAPRILNEQSLAHLHESAWLENVMEFISDDEVDE